MEIPVIISFTAYMLVMIGIGFYFYFKTDDLSDFVLGGRSLGPGVMALSAVTPGPKLLPPKTKSLRLSVLK